MDDVTIANMALSAIGTRSDIASMTEGSAESNTVNLIYANTRGELLRKFNWGFAINQQFLAVWKAAQGTPENPTGATPSPPLPWLYSYAYPSFCIAARYILPIAPAMTAPGIPISSVPQSESPWWVKRDMIKFKTAGDQDSQGNAKKVILTNMRQAQLVFTGRVYDPNIWDELFIAAYIGRLAAKLVIPLAGDKKLAQLAIAEGNKAEIEAERIDGAESTFSTDHTPDWIIGRYFIGDRDDDSNYG